MNRSLDRDPAGPQVPMSRAALFRTDRIVAMALPMGVLGFWAVSLALRSGQERGPVFGVSAATATNALLALMLAAVITAFMLRSRAVSEGEEARRGGAGDLAGLAGMRSKLIIAWALLEAPALLAGVAHFMSGVEQVLVWVAPVYLAGVALTFPRADWYGPEPRGP